MRRSASQIIRNLERRIAHLEKQSSRDLDIMELAEIIGREFSRTYQLSLSPSAIGEIEMGLHDFFSDFLSDPFEDDYADDSIYDLVFEVKEVKTDLRFVQMTVVVHYGFGESEVVKFQAHSKRRGGVEIKKASSSRFAQESFKRGDMVMLLTVKPGQAGSYANPGQVEAVMGDEVRVSVGMASLIVPVEDLVKATGRKSENVEIWQANH
tara:strand:+ start:621 stop:1247 length:627 start_codon:yes stop_codon:yes gene_type:complete